MKKAFPLICLAPLLAQADPKPETRPAELGELVVEAMKSDLTSEVGSAEADAFVRRDLAEALTILPGISLQRTGGRAETGITLRGFDLRQVPVFIDGIPVYVPYDGYADLGRFTVPEAGEIEVSKSISPVLAGPNTLGGLVNVFTRRPQERIEGSVRGGAFTGGGREASVSAGGREEKGYWLFDVAWIEQDAFPLSDDFRPVATENGGYRNNSYHEDFRTSGRVAWTPAVDDEYAFGFWIQRGEKGTPPYTGTDPTIRPRFWQWPQWDKSTYYILTKTALDPDTTLETKFYYDQFQNTLQAFDDAKYSTQIKPSSFTSVYDDWTAGFSARLENRSLKDTRLAAAVHYKVDHHEEYNVGFPRYTFEDATASLGFEAEHSFTPQDSVTLGVSHDWREIRDAVDTNSGAPLDGETVSSWNPQLVYRHDFTQHLDGHIGFARKSRFPTIKDRYSYRLGQAIPNPNLQPETADHLDLGLGGTSTDGRFEWTVGAFLARINDAIQRVDNVAFTPGGAGLFQLRNVGEVEHRGLELATNARWTDSIETGVRYAWIHAENRSDPRIRVPGTPEHEVLVFSKLRLHERLRLIPSFTWADSRLVSSTGKRVGIYAKCDLKAEVTLPYDVTLGLGATNLLDRNQQLDEGFPEEGRSYFVNLRYDF